MKRLALALLTFSVLAIAAIAAIGTTEIIKTNSSTSVPAQLTTNETIRCKTIVFTAYKSARVANTGSVWIQYNNSTNDNAGIKLLSGQTLSITAGSGGMLASDFWIDVESANDGVVAVLFQ